MLSLLLSDILVDFSFMIYIINWVLNPLYHSGMGPLNARIKSRCAFMIIKALNTMGLNVTLLNLVGMAIDHYVAIMLPLHYTTVLNVRRSKIMISVLWLAGFISAFSNLASPVWKRKRFHRKLHYCEKAWLSSYQEEYITFATAAVCFTVMCTIYIRIYVAIKGKQRNEVIDRPRNGRSRDKTKRNTRALLTTSFILGSFTICWLPLCIFQITMIIMVYAGKHLLTPDLMNALATMDKYMYLLVLINTVCDPIIYAIRIGEVRYGILHIVEKFLPKKLKTKLLLRFNKDFRHITNGPNSPLFERRPATQTSSFDSSVISRYEPASYRSSVDKCTSLDDMIQRTGAESMLPSDMTQHDRPTVY